MLTNPNVVQPGTASTQERFVAFAQAEAKEFKPLEWTRILCSQVGVSINEIPSEVARAIAEAQAKQVVNKIFFDWFNTRPVKVTTFTEDDLYLFKKAISVEHSEEYQSIISARLSQQREVTRLNNSVHACARNIAKYNEKMRLLLNQSSVDITSEVQLIVSDGWYRYESDYTKAMNSGSEEPCLYFTTPRVNMSFYNKAVGAEMNVDMGRYLIKYQVRTGVIEVKTHEDNLSVEGYIHPHVASDNTLCWGNASAHYSKSMVEHTPSLAFKSMRVILQTYNDESPYRSISEFALARNPNIFKDRPLVYERCAGNAWVRAGDLPSGYRMNDVIEEQDPDSFDDSDDQLILMRVYEQQYQGTGVRTSNSDVFLRVRNDDGSMGYQAVNIDEWE